MSSFFPPPPDIFLICFSYLRVSRCDTFSIVLATDARNNSMRQFHSEISIVLCCCSFINCRLESIISWLTGKRTSYDAARTKGATQTARATTESNRDNKREREGERERESWKWKNTRLSRTQCLSFIRLRVATHAFNAESSGYCSPNARIKYQWLTKLEKKILWIKLLKRIRCVWCAINIF